MSENVDQNQKSQENQTLNPENLTQETPNVEKIEVKEETIVSEKNPISDVTATDEQPNKELPKEEVVEKHEALGIETNPPATFSKELMITEKQYYEKALADLKSAVVSLRSQIVSLKQEVETLKNAGDSK